ncbi:hypothetical protein OFB63_33175, partial [Escherichia coli]|nr:hypothetical protein [Escherichia coli]
PILRKSSLLVITLGPLDNENTVAPFAENVFATVESRPFIIVTTAIIEATPTITPSNVRNVRSLLTARLLTDSTVIDQRRTASAPA